MTTEQEQGVYYSNLWGKEKFKKLTPNAKDIRKQQESIKNSVK